ncbi:tRNA (guanine(10)-N(2))-dimethyltransferase [Methanobrevibacter filiformis]|uniref:tRNA (guanine(26)-N(2))-dimethyltransferase n=1 Tax=Methanobrevibacter filiformis TaxID=55758 RepID=A0A162FQP9_9EURY|nr:tRNA (guanine(10)-N(2))-dimethyltransferase [Methanobrevibacter filiformis]KZX13690.1 tRNA (guanine(26)-N(2)/guanine(27)-N(2))-dimethyltransferase [Methanobrevibacter filiformis]
MDDIEGEKIENMKIIDEGLIKIKIPEFDKISSEAPVFYNPNMEFNRDISILALQTFQKELNRKIAICDLFGGSGIRGIRYKKEITDTDEVHVNDISPLAISFAKKNAEYNDVELTFHQNEANILLRQSRGVYDIIDIDPFGTPSYFIDSVAYSIKKNSLLCVTATDTSALCGTYKEPCVRKYNAMPYKSEYCHETGIRILIGFIALTFAKYKKYIIPQLSHSSMHYMRLYLKIKKGSASSDESLKNNIGHIIHCRKCSYRKSITGITTSIPRICPECGEKLKITGPLWVGLIQNKEFIEKMMNDNSKILSTKNEIDKLLETCYKESEAPVTFYDVHELCRIMKISAPKLDKILNTLIKEGYLAIKTHFNPLGIKTDCDVQTLKKIIKRLVN